MNAHDTTRDRAVAAILDASTWADWLREPLAGDASGRRYFRLHKGRRSVIVMDAPPGSGEAVGPFLRIGTHLASLGLCPPAILQDAGDEGVLILEDLGPRHFADWLTSAPQDEGTLYSAAADVLVRVQAAPPPPGLTALTPDHAADMTDLFATWHAPGMPDEAARHMREALCTALADLGGARLVLSLRDFHAENLIWRPEATGTDRVGLLDFQDAVMAPPAYDLASLLRDARRDVSPATVEGTLSHFAEATGADRATLDAAIAVWAVQRNLRILGIFSRLIRCDGKPRYAAFVPRVIAHLRADLAHPALAPLREVVGPWIGEGIAP